MMRVSGRIEDTPIYKALREALVNCLINADYYGKRGVVIKKDPKKLIFENPGAYLNWENSDAQGWRIRFKK